MCANIADIQSATAENRKGKKERRRRNHRMKTHWSPLFHRTTITIIWVIFVVFKYSNTSVLHCLYYKV